MNQKRNVKEEGVFTPAGKIFKVRKGRHRVRGKKGRESGQEACTKHVQPIWNALRRDRIRKSEIVGEGKSKRAKCRIHKKTQEEDVQPVDKLKRQREKVQQWERKKNRERGRATDRECSKKRRRGLKRGNKQGERPNDHQGYFNIRGCTYSLAQGESPSSNRKRTCPKGSNGLKKITQSGNEGDRKKARRDGETTIGKSSSQRTTRPG